MEQVQVHCWGCCWPGILLCSVLPKRTIARYFFLCRENVMSFYYCAVYTTECIKETGPHSGDSSESVHAVNSTAVCCLRKSLRKVLQCCSVQPTLWDVGMQREAVRVLLTDHTFLTLPTHTHTQIQVPPVGVSPAQTQGLPVGQPSPAPGPSRGGQQELSTGMW